ncbi:MAG TPA: hypothetical protein VFV23_13050 [Verrucomicrobiae bacterium]|nr:hypothetical protein [Verrucomicrobiae bacterium]
MLASNRSLFGTGLLAAALTTAMFCPAKTSALTVRCDYGNVFNGSTPGGGAPWLRAEFTDSGVNTVQLTLSVLSLGAGEYVSDWYFNFDPLLNASSLRFDAQAPDHGAGNNAFYVFEGGLYDVAFSLDEPFTTGDSITFSITRKNGDALSASDFDYFSSPLWILDDPYLSAAHIEGISDGRQCWYAGGGGWLSPEENSPTGVPDSSQSAILLAAGLIALSLAVRTQKIISV